ncbi:uncharacterized protein [Cebidichthys violaceus]|uniref:uncharacterized protein n=1 Tax=Cebidichthys violaceus TaxID=271503 RepID=UPI0035C9622A
MTASESKRKTTVAVQDEPSKQKEFSVQKTDPLTASIEIKDIEKDIKEHKEASQSKDRQFKSLEIQGLEDEPKIVLSKVVKFKDKLVKVSPMEGTTEVNPDRDSVSPAIEVKHPESLLDRETLKKPGILSEKKDVAQKVRQQTEDEDRVNAVVKDKPKEKTKKPRPEQAEKQSSVRSEQEGPPKPTVDHYTPEIKTTKAQDSGRKNRAVKGEDDLHFKEREQMSKETKDLTDMVTTEDQQHIVPRAEKINTGKEQTERKASTTPVIKSLTEPDTPERKEPMFAKTEEIKESQLKRVTSKRQTSKTKKGKEAFLSETPQIEEVPLKSEVEVKSEVRGDEINKCTEKCIPTEEQKTKKTVFRKLSIEGKEKQKQQKPIKGKSDDVQSKIQDETAEDTFFKVTEQERTERTSSISPIIKITHEESLKAGDGSETAKVVPSETSQKQIHLVMDTTSSEPDINIKPSRSAELPAEDESSENIPLKDEVAQKETRQSRDKTDKIKIKEVQSKTDEQRDKLSPNVQPEIVKAEDKIPKVSKTEEQKQRERKAKTVESEYSQEPQQKLAKPQEIIVEQDQLKVSTFKDKTFKVTPFKGTKSKQELIDRTVSVQPLMEETSEVLEVAPEKPPDEEIDSFGEKPSETSIFLKEGRKKLAKGKEAADKQIPSKSVSVEDKTEQVTPIKDRTSDTQAKTKDFLTERETFDDSSESESESPQEPQKLTKPQDIIVEQDQLKVSTVKDKTFKVTSIKETKPEQIKKKVSVQPLMEETSEELKVAPKKHAENQETECVTDNNETEESESISQKESISLKDRRQTLTKTKKAADEQIQSKSVTVENKIVKATPIEDGTPKIAEQLIKRKVSGASEVEVQLPHTKHLMEQDTQKTGKEGIPKSEARYSKEETQKIKRLQKLPKTGDKIEEEFQTVVLIKDRKDQTPLTEDEKTKQEQEYLLRQTEPEETVKGDTSVSLQKDEAQKHKRPKSAESKEITVKEVQVRTVRVTDEYGSVTSLEATNVQQEQAEIMTSVVPAMKDAAKKHLTIKDNDVKTNIPQQMISADDVVKDVSLTKEKEVEGEISSKLISVQSKTEKVSPIEKKTLKRRQQIEITASSTTEPEATYEKSDALEKYAETKRTDEDKETGKRDVSEFETTHPKKEKTLTEREEKPTKTVKEIQPIRDSKKDKTDKIVEKSQIVEDGDSLSDPSKQIPVKQAKNKEDIVKDKQEKTEGKSSVSGAAQPEVTYEHSLIDTHPVTDQTTTVLPAEEIKTRQTQIQTKTAVSPVMKGKDLEDVSQKKEETKTEKPLMFDNTSIEDIQTKTSLKEKSQRLSKSTKTSLEEVLSKTVVVKDNYGSVTPFEVTETKQEQVGRKVSVAPVMEVASERSLIVTEGDVKTETLRRSIASDKQLKVTEQVMSKVDLVQDQTEMVSAIGEELPERQEQIKRKTSVASKPEVTSKVTPEIHSEMDKTTRVLQAEEIKTRQKQTETKTAVTSVTDTEIKHTEPKKSKSLKEKGQRSDKVTRIPLKEVQCETVTVKDEYESVAPINVMETKQEQVQKTASVAAVMDIASEKHLVVKEGDVKSDTLQRFMSPDKLIKDIASKKEDVYESSEVLLVKHSQSPESSKKSVEVLAEKQKITDKTDRIKFVDDTMLTKQKHTQQKTQEILGEDTKTEVVVRDHPRRHEEVRYYRTKKPDSLEDQGKVTVEGVQSKTDTVKDVFLSVSPNGETKQEQIERKASSTPVMHVAYTKPLIVKEQDVISETPQKYISPDDLFKDIPSRKTEAYKSEDVKRDKSRLKLDQSEEFKVRESKSKVEKLGEKTTKVLPDSTAKVLGKDKIIKEVQEKEKGEIKATGQQQIKGNRLVVPRKRNEEMYQEIVEVKVSDKNIPSTTESKSDIDLKPTVREPSVTDKTRLNTTDSPEYEQVSTRKQEPEVERSLKADIRSFPPREAETISSRKGEAQGLQSVIKTRALQDSSRGIEGKTVMCHRARVFDLSTKHRCAPPRFFTLLRIS